MADQSAIHDRIQARIELNARLAAHDQREQEEFLQWLERQAPPHGEPAIQPVEKPTAR